MPPMSSSFESSQSQQFTSVQQSSSSFSAQQQSQSEIYESQEFNGGVMKGYRRKDEASTNGSHGARDSGIFTGINGDANSLVDETFDYKKHTVKDLAAHFALVKPKQNIPSNILPEQRNYNGGQAPQLNYLGANEAGATVTSQQTARRELSQQDIEASKQAYEMKKKQQMEAKQTTTTTTTTDSSSVVRRTTETSSEQKSERRMSLRDSLMLDPAQAHADAGLIDPSAILRGEAVTHWKTSDPSPTQLSLGAVSSSPSAQMYISRKDPTKTFAPIKFSTLPRGSSSNSSSSSSLGQSSKSLLPPLPPANSSSKPPISSHTNSRVLSQNQLSQSPNIIINSNTHTTSSSTVHESQSLSDPPLIFLVSSSPDPPSHTLHKHTLPSSSSNTQQNVSEKQSVIQTMLKTTVTGQGDAAQDELAVSLNVQDSISRSSAPTPCPTTPFPGLDSQASSLAIPSSPNLSIRPRTPILVTTRPSSVSLDRTRHVSKEDIAKMMAELNEPLPPMLDIPTEIRASPLIFSGGLAAVPSHPHPQSSAHPHSALSLSTIMSPSSTVRNQ